MRVLFTPLTWPTHYQHMVALAWALRAGGHEVRIACQPPLVGTVRDTGMIAFPMGHGYDVRAGFAEANRRVRETLGKTLNADIRANLTEEERRTLRSIVYEPHVRAAEAMADDLIAILEGWRPDLVVTDPMMYVAPLAAEIVGVPLVRILFGPDMTRHLRFPGLSGPGEGDPRDRWPEALLKVFDRYGATVRDEYALRVVDPCPPSMQLPGGSEERLTIRYVPFNGTGEAPRWLLDAPERPRVCVTWGTMTTALTGKEGWLVPSVLDALADLDVEIVAAVRESDAALLGTVPGNVRVVHDLPLQVLLPTCDVIVNQGGSGSLLTAAYYGLPQVVIARVTDQTFNAERLAVTGAGAYLGPEDSDGEGIRTAVAAALAPHGEPRVAAARLREEIHRQPAPADVARTLERLITSAQAAR
jgi:UDP:flavonoid glycosyltransferase YjiC (YdhE family)